MKMYLNEFTELTMEALLAVNGGYTSTHSTVPAGYSPTTGWEPGLSSDGYTPPKVTEPAAPAVVSPVKGVWGEIDNPDSSSIRMLDEKDTPHG